MKNWRTDFETQSPRIEIGSQMYFMLTFTNKFIIIIYTTLTENLKLLFAGVV